jgi:glyoxylase-like metal-dependent hydrolase (beta-lactamase superfamily II)
MGKLKVDHYVVGPVQTNCYVAVNSDTKECFVVDPGAAASQLAERIRKDGYTPVAVLLTHGHFDHAGAAEDLAKEFGAKIYAHEKEEDTLNDPGKNLSGWEGQMVSYHADVYLKDEEELDLAGLHIRVLHTPGHTTGGCCYYLPYEDVLFSGDTLFAQSVGRTDFPGGSMSQIVRSINDKLLVLPEHTTVYPGHNDATSIETERMYNPYL